MAGACWSSEEDTKLAEAVGRLGTNWTEVSAHVQGRDPISCKNRWNRCTNRMISEAKAAPPQILEAKALVEAKAEAEAKAKAEAAREKAEKAGAKRQRDQQMIQENEQAKAREADAKAAANEKRWSERWSEAAALWAMQAKAREEKAAAAALAKAAKAAAAALAKAAKAAATQQRREEKAAGAVCDTVERRLMMGSRANKLSDKELHTVSLDATVARMLEQTSAPASTAPQLADNFAGSILLTFQRNDNGLSSSEVGAMDDAIARFTLPGRCPNEALSMFPFLRFSGIFDMCANWGSAILPLIIVEHAHLVRTLLNPALNPAGPSH